MRGTTMQRRWVTGLFGAAMAVSCLQAQTPAAAPTPPLSDTEKIYGLSKLWQEVNYNFAFFDRVPQLNWDSTYQAFIPQVLTTRSTYEYYRVLQRFIALLNDGHSGVTMPPAVQQANPTHYPWILTRRVGDQVLVQNVGVSLEGQVPVGAEIVSVEGVPAAEHAERYQRPYIGANAEHVRRDQSITQLLYGDVDTPVEVTLRLADGAMRTVALRRDRRTRTDEWRLPANQPAPPRFEMRMLDGGLAYVALNTFGTDSTAIDFVAALPQLRQARGLVLDIRGNGGGNSSVGWRIASHLTNDTLVTSKWRTREHRAAPKAWGSYPGAPPSRWTAYGAMNAWFDGGEPSRVAPASSPRLIVPTVVLTGHGTASAAEDFLVVIDKVPHITIIGQPSNGSTGQPLFLQLPGGGSARIVTKRDTYPDGREFVGPGVIPDVRIEPTVEDVRAGRDPVLAGAVEHLRARIR